MTVGGAPTGAPSGSGTPPNGSSPAGGPQQGSGTPSGNPQSGGLWGRLSRSEQIIAALVSAIVAGIFAVLVALITVYASRDDSSAASTASPAGIFQSPAVDSSNSALPAAVQGSTGSASTEPGVQTPHLSSPTSETYAPKPTNPPAPPEPAKILNIRIETNDGNVAPGVYKPVDGWQGAAFTYRWTTVTNYGDADGNTCKSSGTIYNLTTGEVQKTFPTSECSIQNMGAILYHLPPADYKLTVDVTLESGSRDSSDFPFTVIPG